MKSSEKEKIQVQIFSEFEAHSKLYWRQCEDVIHISGLWSTCIHLLLQHLTFPTGKLWSESLTNPFALKKSGKIATKDGKDSPVAQLSQKQRHINAS